MRSRKTNCWEALKCGREPGGFSAGKFGTCPAAVNNLFDGFNQGSSGGRLCWLVAGTFCDGEVQGTFAKKQTSCRDCSFYKQVHSEEGTARILSSTTDAIAISNKGRELAYNDDRYFMRILADGSILIGVADGLGGEVSGDYAAELMIGRLASIHSINNGFETEQLIQLAKESDQAIFEESKKYAELSAMGTTFLCVLIRENRVYWVHVGDSRLYHFHKFKLLQITEDQTLARFLVEEEEIKPDQISSHYSRHVMDQFIGCGYCEPETGSLNLMPKDLIILATDGLHKALSEQRIAKILTKNNSVDARARSLLDKALENEEGDNITIVLAEFKNQDV